MPIETKTTITTDTYFSSLAALGLVENNAPNITAAMLVSPLMGPVMSITFGAMISDRDLIVSPTYFIFASTLVTKEFTIEKWIYLAVTGNADIAGFWTGLRVDLRFD